ncbi:hypothetical protein BOX30_09110 [Leptospirillum ferriphilum]|nr:hypothetical protein BOX30_09110 [Leptospirillum ferriphilum]
MMSDPSDFKIATIPYKSQTHLILEPIKDGAESDLIIFGVDHVHYLSVKTVSKGHRHEMRVEIGAQILDSPR